MYIYYVLVTLFTFLAANSIAEIEQAEQYESPRLLVYESPKASFNSAVNLADSLLVNLKETKLL